MTHRSFKYPPASREELLQRKVAIVQDIASEIGLFATVLPVNHPVLGIFVSFVLADEPLEFLELPGDINDAVEIDVASSPWPAEAMPPPSAKAAAKKASKRRTAKRRRPPLSRTKKPVSRRRKGAR